MAKEKRSKKHNSQGCPSIFGKVFDEKSLRDIIKHTRPLLKYLAENKPFTPKDADRHISKSEIDKAVALTMQRLPLYLRKANRRLPVKTETEDINNYF